MVVRALIPLSGKPIVYIGGSEFIDVLYPNSDSDPFATRSFNKTLPGHWSCFL